MSRFKLSSITKAVTEAINAAPDVDALSKSLGAPPLAPRIVAEYGSLHSATCVDYDPVQRLLAVGVDTGVKVLGADGLSVLLATPRHLEPALRVRFVSSVGRVIRVSVESGVDVWDLRSQTLLASTRWPNEVTAVAALRRSPFILLGEASGTVRVAAARPGADGGVLAPRAYAVTSDQAMGVVPWELRSVEELEEASAEGSKSSAFRESGEETSRRDATSKAACVAVEPQPGFETARVLFAFADGRLALWDLHAKKPAAVASPEVAGTPAASLRCATWVGNGGGVIATGHDDGAARLWIVPALGKPGSARRNAVAIACVRAFHPRPGASADERMPVRALAVRAEGAAGSAMAGRLASGHRASGSSVSRGENPDGDSRSAVVGVLACVGGEVAGAPDPAVLVPLELDSAFGPPQPADAREAGAAALPYFGPVTAVALASPPFRPEEAAAAATLSEGGQIHVHDARALMDSVGRRDPPAVSSEALSNADGGDEASAESKRETEPTPAREPLPAEEIVELMPRLAVRCAPAATAASPGVVRRFAGALDAAGTEPFRSRRDAWGDAWPLTGGAVDDAGRWFKGSVAVQRNVVAAASAEGAAVRVCVEGVGRFVPAALASPGPNAGMSAKDRAVTLCHLACGGAMLVVGRQCGAVEVHVALEDLDASAVRVLDGGLDLRRADPRNDGGRADTPAAEKFLPGYVLVGELGAHAAAVTCVETHVDSAQSLLFVGDAAGVCSVTDLREGVLRFTRAPFRDGKGDEGEGVAAAAFCAPVVGTTARDEDETRRASESAGGENAVHGASATSPPVTFSGAEMVTVASTGSAVAFLGVASGDVLGKPCRPKTASPALAVAPLDARGAARRRGEPRAALRRADEGLAAGSPWFWFTRRAAHEAAEGEKKTRAAEDGPKEGGSDPDDERDSLVALVAVASAEALRVYPANGAIRGERHTLKKASADERLVAAALVTPRAGGGDEEDANEKEPASAFAAVSAHGRVLVWALPGLAPLASVGPTPPVSSADATCFGADGGGSLFAFAGGGGAIARLALAAPARGPKARPESGLMFWDEDMATAADAADEAAEMAASETSACATRAEQSPSRRAFAGDAVSALGGDDVVSETARERETPSTPSKDLAAAGRSMLKGDARSAMASFGSVMRGAKEKAKEAATSLKDKAKTAVDAVKEHLAEEEDPPRATAADLAMLFADVEVRRPPSATTTTTTSTTRGKPAKKESASSKLGFSMLTSRTTANAAAAAAASAPGTDPDAGRAELFRTASGGSPSGGGSAAPRMSSADEIRAKYGKAKAKDSAASTSELKGNLEETRHKLAERGEKLSSLQDKTAQMQSDAEDFHSMAQKLAAKQKSWW